MTINTSYNSYASGGYYQLGSQSSAAADTIASANKTTNAAAEAAGFSSAYLLDLSPGASSYLNGIGNNAAQPGSDFVLTSEQQDQVIDILKKYQDAPQTQETFNQIQDDLRQAGLDPDRLAALKQASSFNPTQVFMDILSGKTDESETMDPNAISQQMETQKSNYLQKIISLWKGMAESAAEAAAEVG